ncbi:MAG: hypothetical protein R2715_01695 [Ilumatobacteraceae bacterium]
MVTTSLDELRERCRADVDRLDPGVRRLVNPHVYHVAQRPGGALSKQPSPGPARRGRSQPGTADGPTRLTDRTRRHRRRPSPARRGAVAARAPTLASPAVATMGPRR